MSSVFYRNPHHVYPKGLRGEGVYLYDTDGRQYLDGSGGAAVSCVGHGHPDVIAAIKAQVDELAYAHTAFFTNEPQERLAEYLAARFGESGARVYFLSGGSEANETAIKLVRQYWVAQGQESKHLIVSRHQSYHGNTLGALSLSGSPGRRDMFAPLLHDWPKIVPCYAYRHQDTGETDEDYGVRAAQALDDAVLEHGARNIAAFIAETVVGATMGAVPPVTGYLARVREICDRHEILLVFDEVMAGCGRCGTYFAFEQDDVLPDIVTLAKGLGGGYQPIGAAIARGFIHDKIAEVHGSFSHGHTYIGHATACRAALAVADVVDREGLLANVERIGTLLRSELESALREHPHVGDIRGRGLLLGVELVINRDDKTPADPSVAASIKSEAMANGLIVYPGGGTADGRRGAHILVAPPFIYGDKHVDELVTKLARVLAAVQIDAGKRSS